MKRLLSRLESEYMLSRVAASKPALRVSVSAATGGEGSFTYSAVCRPEAYSCDPQTRRFFFDEAFLKENRIPAGVSCSFSFFYETRSLCFSAEISASEGIKEGRLSCRAARLFYAEGESFFLPSIGAKLFFIGEPLSGHLSMRVHKGFPLDTADLRGRTARFLQLEAGKPGFSNVLEDYSVAGGNGVLFYLDHIRAMACFPASSAAALFPRGNGKSPVHETVAQAERLIEEAIALNGSQQQGLFCANFGLRKIRAECASAARVFRTSLLFFRIDFASLEPENIRFLYEMSRKEKYLGGEFPESG